MLVAHAGHWATNLIYIAPLVAILALLGWQQLRDRRSITAGGMQSDLATSARDNDQEE